MGSDANRILAEFKAKLDEHYGFDVVSPPFRGLSEEQTIHIGSMGGSFTIGGSPVKPEHRVSDETAARFAKMLRDEDAKDAKPSMSLEDRIARIEEFLGLTSG